MKSPDKSLFEHKGVKPVPQAKPLHKNRHTLLAPNLDTLAVARGKWTPEIKSLPIRVVHRTGLIDVVIGNRVAQFDTIKAHDLGKVIIQLALNSTADEAIILIVNGERIGLTLDQAKNLAKGLLRKADSADDFQINHNVRLVK